MVPLARPLSGDLVASCPQGLILGPGWISGSFLDPNELFGDLLPPAVSLAVALILFEGGLTLNLREHKSASGVRRADLRAGDLRCR
jgi:NhaP-type Na+/H+ or K+/H+ antiporter